MATVTCRFFGSLRQVVGDQREEKIEVPPTGANLGDLLNALVEKHGEAFAKRMIIEGGELSPSVLVSITGRSEHTARRLETVLHDGDEVTFVNALAGG